MFEFEVLCKFGESTYYLFDDGSVRRGMAPETARVIYTETPISAVYREFMPTNDLFIAMKERGLIEDV